MTVLRTHFLAALFAVLLVPGLTLLAPGRAGTLPNVNEVVSVQMTVEPVGQKLHIHVTGAAGQVGVVRMALLPLGGSSLVFMDVPFTLTAAGNHTWITDLVNFEVWPAFDCVAQVLTTSNDGSIQYSDPWGLRMRRYPLAQVAGIPLPSGGATSIPMPGTTTPLFPVTWTAIQGRALGSTSYECLIFATAVPGIEGVLPVN